MEHEMLLVDADFKVVARMKARRKHASQAQQAAHLIRTQKDSVQVGGEAPQDCESE